MRSKYLGWPMTSPWRKVHGLLLNINDLNYRLPNTQTMMNIVQQAKMKKSKVFLVYFWCEFFILSLGFFTIEERVPNLLCNCKWPWTANPLSHISQVLGWQASIIMPTYMNLRMEHRIAYMLGKRVTGSAICLAFVVFWDIVSCSPHWSQISSQKWFWTPNLPVSASKMLGL